MSAAQKQRIQDKHFEDSRAAWMFLLFITGIGLLGSTGAAINEGIPLVEMWLGLAISMLTIGVFIGALIVYYRAQMYRTIRDGQFAQEHGHIWLTHEGGKDRIHYFQVGRQRFQITRQQYSQLKRAEVARCEAIVYYTTRWRRILSVDLNPNSSQD